MNLKIKQQFKNKIIFFTKSLQRVDLSNPTQKEKEYLYLNGYQHLFETIEEEDDNRNDIEKIMDDFDDYNE